MAYTTVFPIDPDIQEAAEIFDRCCLENGPKNYLKECPLAKQCQKWWDKLQEERVTNFKKEDLDDIARRFQEAREEWLST
jgi:hypothetical protein